MRESALAPLLDGRRAFSPGAASTTALHRTAAPRAPADSFTHRARRPGPAGQTMITNDVLRSIRYMLDLSDLKVVEIVKLADPDFALDKAEVQAFLKKDEDEGYAECSDAVLARFLDGLVFHYRGRDENAPPRPMEKRVSNNLVLKKLRVAFELKDVDMHQVFEQAGFPVSKPELSALFRQSDHKNFRACGDQMLRNFLKGLTLRVRGG
jgi:uncharacterized protein YehS (DUF1456 family)